MLLSIIELRIPCFDPRKSLPTPDYRPIIGGIRRNREMPFPLVLSDSRIREVNWIFISWNVSSFRRTCATNIWNATRLCPILFRLTKRENPISIHRDLRFLFPPPLFHFFTLTRISSGCMHVLERGVRRKKRRGRGEGGERGGIDFWGLE